MAQIEKRCQFNAHHFFEYLYGSYERLRVLENQKCSRWAFQQFGNGRMLIFSDEAEESDTASGTIYVLRSKSDYPAIKEHRDVIHTISVTSGDVKKRLVNAKLDPTFLMADVEVIATYVLSNINRAKLENLIHRFFEPAKLNIEIKDRFGNPIIPREWFLVPLHMIDEAVEKIKDGSIVHHIYAPNEGKIVKKK